jgi:hypothetical protein
MYGHINIKAKNYTTQRSKNLLIESRAIQSIETQLNGQGAFFTRQK